MESTTLNLLTRDGTVTVQITPVLDSEHYSELYEIAQHSSDDANQLRAAVSKACNRWGCTVSFS